MATKKAARSVTKRAKAVAKLAKKASARKVYPEQRCATGVCNPQRTQGLLVSPAQGSHNLVTLRGPGVFLGAHVSKQGGNTGLTFPDLTIDGRNVVNASFAGVENLGFTQQNPYGLVLLGNQIKNMTFGWPTPLRFERELRLSVTVNEAGIVQILANVIHGTA